MTDRLLEDIIQWEKQIQRKLAAEQQRVDAWLAHEIAALDEALEQARGGDSIDGKALEKARLAAVREGEAMVRAAEAWCARLQNLEEGFLLNILLRHLNEIMPEGVHDHPHGEN